LSSQRASYLSLARHSEAELAVEAGTVTDGLVPQSSKDADVGGRRVPELGHLRRRHPRAFEAEVAIPSPEPLPAVPQLALDRC
jgi:hypothetical protein